MSVEVTVPGSSANLGPGYDTLALALAIRLRVTVTPSVDGESTLDVEGEGADQLGWNDDNRFRAGLLAGATDTGSAGLPPLRVKMRNDIPLGRGLGSSAAATVAGLLVARELLGAPSTAERLVELATRIEGHPENAAASLHGGFVVCAAGRVVRYDPPAELRAVVYVPQRQLATADMRAVLPREVAHADAAHNAGATAAIVSAFATGDLELLAAMYDDRLHQPFRSTAYPELPILVGAAREAGALGAALSGAGSSVLALCTEAATAGVADALTSAANAVGLAGRAHRVGLA